ncbi:unnamed protein product [Aureobasidium vineae]|uniref:F-box domain-containing protein n=1 Tax=Aureobasidium vineae TaxID=2773715 RepID=A0A9N8JME8_9PEZI|nr:unnamed protein product [Aureobasidium vineae]
MNPPTLLIHQFFHQNHQKADYVAYASVLAQHHNISKPSSFLLITTTTFSLRHTSGRRPMDGSAPLADPNAMASLIPPKPTLSALPPELLDRIFWLVDRPDLVNLRFVPKSICAIANRPFAVRNFSNRSHVITKHSIETLLAISAHETFGAYIRAMVFNPARKILKFLDPDFDEEENTVVDNPFVDSGEFSDLMQQILANTRRFSPSMTIGLPGYGRFLCRGDRFYLVYRDGEETFEIHGDNVCEELEELTCYVAAAETQKIQKFIRDGLVDDDLVGLFDQA